MAVQQVRSARNHNPIPKALASLKRIEGLSDASNDLLRHVVSVYSGVNVGGQRDYAKIVYWIGYWADMHRSGADHPIILGAPVWLLQHHPDPAVRAAAVGSALTIMRRSLPAHGNGTLRPALRWLLLMRTQVEDSDEVKNALRDAVRIECFEHDKTNELTCKVLARELVNPSPRRQELASDGPFEEMIELLGLSEDGDLTEMVERLDALTSYASRYRIEHHFQLDSISARLSADEEAKKQQVASSAAGWYHLQKQRDAARRRRGR